MSNLAGPFSLLFPSVLRGNARRASFGNPLHLSLPRARPGLRCTPPSTQMRSRSLSQAKPEPKLSPDSCFRPSPARRRRPTPCVIAAGAQRRPFLPKQARPCGCATGSTEQGPQFQGAPKFSGYSPLGLLELGNQPMFPCCRSSICLFRGRSAPATSRLRSCSSHSHIVAIRVVATSEQGRASRRRLRSAGRRVIEHRRNTTMAHHLDDLTG